MLSHSPLLLQKGGGIGIDCEVPTGVQLPGFFAWHLLAYTDDRFSLDPLVHPLLLEHHLIPPLTFIPFISLRTPPLPHLAPSPFHLYSNQPIYTDGLSEVSAEKGIPSFTKR